MKKDVEIHLKTTGTDKAATDVKKVANASEGLDKAVEESTRSAAEATGRFRDLNHFLEETQDRARAAGIAFYNLDEEITKANASAGKTPQELDRFKRSADGAEKSTRNNAQALLMFSQGFEDAQYGIRGVLNNIPGLVMALGGGMGLAGGISIAAVALTQLISLFGDAKEESEDLANAIDDIARAAGENLIERLEKIRSNRQAINFRLNVDESSDTEGQAARAAAFQQQQNSINALIAATNTLNDLMGRQVAAAEKIAASEMERQRALTAAADEQIQKEKEKTDAMRHSLVEAERSSNAARQSAYEARLDLDTQRERLAMLRQQREEAERLAVAQYDGPRNQAFPGVAPSLTDEERGFIQRQRQARELLDNQGFQAELAAAQESVNRLEGLVHSRDDAMTTMGNAVYAATAALERREAAQQETIETITERLEVGLAQSGVDGATQRLSAITSIVSQTIEEAGAAGQQLGRVQSGALEELRAAMSDGRITADEIHTVATNMSILRSTWQGDITRILQLQSDFVQVSDGIQQKLSSLEANVARLQLDVAR